MGLQVGIGWLMLWLGAATPSDGMGQVSDYVSTERGNVDGMDGCGVHPVSLPWATP